MPRKSRLLSCVLLCRCALGPDGWFRCRFERDDKGRITKIEYQDTNENPTDRGAGYAWEEREYDDDLVYVTRYDMSGNKVKAEGGAVTIVREEDEDGLISPKQILVR